MGLSVKLSHLIASHLLKVDGHHILVLLGYVELDAETIVFKDSFMALTQFRGKKRQPNHLKISSQITW